MVLEAGALTGVRVIDMSSLGPGPFCGMMLADHGADVIEVRRPVASTRAPDPSSSFSRGKRSITVNLRTEGGRDVIARLAERADVLLESNRPGTLERRGLGPDELMARNPRLVYTRLTGWGQHGPYARRVGHDINFIAGAGLLGVIAAPGDDAPVVPMNLLGDFASGSLFALIGTALALLQRERTGRGQVVDAAMVDGAALLLTAQLEELNDGAWTGRGKSILSGVAPFYGTYRCADGRWFAIGAIEPRFYAAMLEALGIADEPVEREFDAQRWAQVRRRVASALAGQPRDHWTKVFADIEGCGTPVLELDELAEDPHLRARGTVTIEGDRLRAAAAPRLSANALSLRPRPAPGAHTREVLSEHGFSDEELATLIAAGVVR